MRDSRPAARLRLLFVLAALFCAVAPAQARAPVYGPARVQAVGGEAGSNQPASWPARLRGLLAPGNWLPGLERTFGRMFGAVTARAAPGSTALSDLPLIEVPAKTAGGDTLAVLLTGDGGWAPLVRHIGAGLAERGISVVAVDSLRYFWSARTPEEVAGDLDLVIGHYATAWKRPRVILVGYSFGADLLPFVARRLAPENRARIVGMALLGLSGHAEFELHLGSPFGWSSPEALPVAPEIAALQALPMVCAFGAEERDSLCRRLDGANVTKVETRGRHHFGGDFKPILDAIAPP